MQIYEIPLYSVYLSKYPSYMLGLIQSFGEISISYIFIQLSSCIFIINVLSEMLKTNRRNFESFHYFRYIA